MQSHKSKQILAIKCVYKVKHNIDGSIERYSVHCVAKDHAHTMRSVYFCCHDGNRDNYFCHPKYVYKAFYQTTRSVTTCKDTLFLYNKWLTYLNVTLLYVKMCKKGIVIGTLFLFNQWVPPFVCKQYWKKGLYKPLLCHTYIFMRDLPKYQACAQEYEIIRLHNILLPLAFVWQMLII